MHLKASSGLDHRNSHQFILLNAWRNKCKQKLSAYLESGLLSQKSGICGVGLYPVFELLARSQPVSGSDGLFAGNAGPPRLDKIVNDECPRVQLSEIKT